MVKRFLVYFAIIGMSFSVIAPYGVANDASDLQFFSAIEDVPLMRGLHELEDQTLVFDKPEGRIVESVASFDSLEPLQIQTYYKQSLPQFGWQFLNGFSFVRGQEKLQFSFEEIENQNFFHVTLLPIPLGAK